MTALRFVTVPLVLVLALVLMPRAAEAAERAKIEAFLNVTGFDVALESIRLSAESAPQMLGLQAEDFGSEWTRLANDVFDVDVELTQHLHQAVLEIVRVRVQLGHVQRWARPGPSRRPC